jgi:hypothetical protein
MSTRRDPLASTVGAIVVGGGLPLEAQAAHAHPDGDLLTACASFAAAEALVRKIDGIAGGAYDDDAMDDAIGSWYAALQVVYAIPSRTAVGLRAKASIAHMIFARALKDDHAPPEQSREEFFALSVLDEMPGRVA